MESPSDSVNGVNAAEPLDNNGGEKVVGALLVDDSGTMEKPSQLAEAKHIIPFLFGHGPEGHRRKKRDDSKCAKIMSIGAAVSFSMSALFGAVVLFMYMHIKKVGNNTSSGYQTSFTVVIVLLVIFLSIGISLVSVLCCDCLKDRVFGTGTGQIEIGMIGQAAAQHS